MGTLIVCGSFIWNIVAYFVKLWIIWFVTLVLLGSCHLWSIDSHVCHLWIVTYLLILRKPDSYIGPCGLVHHLVLFSTCFWFIWYLALLHSCIYVILGSIWSIIFRFPLAHFSWLVQSIHINFNSIYIQFIFPWTHLRNWTFFVILTISQLLTFWSIVDQSQHDLTR